MNKEMAEEARASMNTRVMVDLIEAVKSFREDLAYDHGVTAGLVDGCLECDKIRKLDALVVNAEATRPEERESIPADVLRQHYLSRITCNEETLRDNPVCCCSTVNLGWHLSVGDAVEAWVQHVLDEARKASPSPLVTPTKDG